MIDYNEELKFNKHERDKIKAEINDLKSRIVVESGRRHRHEVNAYRNRVNMLQMRMNEISLRIAELEKKAGNAGSQGQIQIISNSGLDAQSIRNGEITVTDTIEFDTGFGNVPGDVVQTVNRTIERTIMLKNGKPVSIKETITENISSHISQNNKNIFIDTKCLK